MSNEQERLRKLRERQLTDRDPLVKQRQFQRASAQKERKARAKGTSLGEEWRMIPHVYRSPLIGFLVGAGITIALILLWDSSWAFWVGVGATVLLIVFGLVTGQALDIRENLKDSIKH
ncbi:MAG: hypothetical protein AB1750_01800 [Chloroflexota bacterium]